LPDLTDHLHDVPTDDSPLGMSNSYSGLFALLGLASR